MLVRELLTKLVFDADQKKVESFEESVKSLTGSLAVLVGAATAATGAAFRLASSTAAYSASLDDAKNVTGFSTRMIQGLGFAAEMTGSSVDVMNGALDTFNRRIGAARSGGGPAVQTLKDMNIQLTDAAGNLRTNEQLLADVADRFSRIKDPALLANYSQNLFNAGARELGVVLAQGSDRLREFTNEYEALGGMLTDEQIQLGAAFDDQLNVMRLAINGIRNEIGTGLMPIFSRMVEQFLEFLQANRDLIMVRVHRVFEVLTSVVRVAARVLGTLWRMADNVAQTLGGWEPTLRLLATLMLALFSARLLRTIASLGASITRAGGLLRWFGLALARIPAVAFITALTLMIDEVWNWVQGNDSAIGRVLGSWENFKTRFRQIYEQAFSGDLLGAAQELADSTLTVFGRLFEGLFGLFGTSGLEVVRDLQRLQDSIEGAFGRAFDRVGDYWDALLARMRQAAIDILPGFIGRNFFRDPSASSDPQLPGGSSWSAMDLPSLPTAGPTWDPSDLPMIQTQRSMSGGRTGPVINDNRQVSIVAPPGSTPEQIDYIRRAIDRTLGQQINAAALSLEVR